MVLQAVCKPPPSVKTPTCAKPYLVNGAACGGFKGVVLQDKVVHRHVLVCRKARPLKFDTDKPVSVDDDDGDMGNMSLRVVHM
eukprot:1160365-Pelagomonas_calceolata.AAC.5